MRTIMNDLVDNAVVLQDKAASCCSAVGMWNAFALSKRSGYHSLARLDLEARVGKDHPLRTIRMVVNAALAGLSGEFSALYARMGRPSISA